ncbi:hypothetical protein PG997_010997 [Apiospora hydei]|uniref:Ubiquitin-like protease family profile domain-containing protein n=1 Tax=Apiospora hydei TaxID=1337664 RepID=A0ABR1VHV1_9PEZI
MKGWLPSAALVTALGTLVEHIVPPSLRSLLYVSNWEGDHFSLNGPSDSGVQAALDLTDAFLKIRVIDGVVRGNRQLHQIRQCAWSILTVNVERNHWVTVIIALTGQDDEDNDNKDYYTRVERISVIEGIDPGPMGDYKVNVYSCVEGLLRFAGLQFTDSEAEPLPENSWRQPIWVPTQNNAYSCGVRAYANIKTMLRRLATAWEAMAPDEGLKSLPPSATAAENRFLWDPMPGWFHYELERWEMVGSNAATIVRACDYQARIAVEVVKRARGPKDDPKKGETSEAKKAINVPNDDDDPFDDDDGMPFYEGWSDKMKQEVRRQYTGTGTPEREKKTPETDTSPEEDTPSPPPTLTERQVAIKEWAGVSVWLNPSPSVRRGGKKRPREDDVVDLTGNNDGGAIPISFNRTRADTGHYTNPFASRQAAAKSVMIRRGSRRPRGGA